MCYTQCSQTEMLVQTVDGKQYKVETEGKFTLADVTDWQMCLKGGLVGPAR
jgi:hypothetical protein